MAAPAEIQLATLNRFIDGWRNWKATDMLAPMSSDVTQKSLPFSLGHPARTREQIEATLPLLQRVVTDYELTIHEIVHDAPKSKAVVYALSKGKTPFGDWTNEYAVFVTFDESGREIAKVEEMIDTAFMKDFYPKFQKYLQEQLASSGSS
ncbi:hypothetical protein BGW36DRAFT_294631 [Talaromyces proteolyticus]|uniref:SnoaL-like domain-containing protein n=1 Tax=Talaromyces proteolyticus TaxID=1131652 RepID=A0AAD4KT64_9EURO|nr:uncharacterized protein BGW36DRAFT_294631 [Talaromyces proteolyticus]KAH8698791.1 hypothetical protein BGW36DRAFT_294631 [Talaromyces proteolyticus]